jgi:hypothetical protein
MVVATIGTSLRYIVSQGIAGQHSHPPNRGILDDALSDVIEAGKCRGADGCLWLQRRRLTQSQAAAILGIDQPKVSALKQGKLTGFSIERLMRFLLALGRDIEITVKRKASSRLAARLRVA